MLLFCAKNIAQAFDGKDIFRQVNFEIQAGEKVALIGVNGVGKTSLLRIVAGIDRPETGELLFFEPVRIELMSQKFTRSNELTIGEYLESSMEPISGSGAIPEILKRFGFAGQEGRKIAGLSGGEKTRLQLARISRLGAGLLLLDEPSNHLDMTNLNWLERFVTGFPGTVILVSHDRYFLDRTVTRVLELSPEGVVDYPGNYTAYQKIKAEREASARKLHEEQLRKRHQLEKAIEEQKLWAGQAHSQSKAKSRANGIRASKIYYRGKAKKMERRVKSTINRLERLKSDTVALPKENDRIRLGFQNAGSRASALVLAKGLGKSYGSRRIFGDLDFSLRPGEKSALIGANGSGKTTLLRIIAGLETPDAGTIWRSPSLKIGYQEQEVRLLRDDRTVLEEVSAETTSDPKVIRNLLAGLLFKGEDVRKPCAVLSMGERVRVTLAKMLLGDYHLLLLDEPTNYLDLASRERLEEALTAFEGAVLMVSHDRYLVEKTAKHIWDLDDGHLVKFDGRYSEYTDGRESKKMDVNDRKAERMALELRKAYLVGQLSTFPKQKDPEEFLRIEEEYERVIQQIRNGV